MTTPSTTTISLTPDGFKIMRWFRTQPAEAIEPAKLGRVLAFSSQKTGSICTRLMKHGLVDAEWGWGRPKRYHVTFSGLEFIKRIDGETR